MAVATSDVLRQTRIRNSAPTDHDGKQQSNRENDGGLRTLCGCPDSVSLRYWSFFSHMLVSNHTKQRRTWWGNQITLWNTLYMICRLAFIGLAIAKCDFPSLVVAPSNCQREVCTVYCGWKRLRISRQVDMYFCHSLRKFCNSKVINTQCLKSLAPSHGLGSPPSFP